MKITLAINDNRIPVCYYINFLFRTSSLKWCERQRSRVLIARTHCMLKNSAVLIVFFHFPMLANNTVGNLKAFRTSVKPFYRCHIILEFSIRTIERQQRLISLFLYPFDFIYSVSLFFSIRHKVGNLWY